MQVMGPSGVGYGRARFDVAQHLEFELLRKLPTFDRHRWFLRFEHTTLTICLTLGVHSTVLVNQYAVGVRIVKPVRVFRKREI